MKVIKDNKVKETYVVILLDDSASMASVKPQTVSGFNEQLQTIKASETLDHKVFVSVILFSDPDKIYTIRDWVSPTEIQPLTINEYQAGGGSTALLDGMDTVLNKLLERSDRINIPGNAALIVFMTDGQNNNSKRVLSKDSIKERILSLTAKGNYTFTYMGVGSIDDITAGFGIGAGNFTQFQFGAAGAAINTNKALHGHTHYFSSRAAGATATSNFYEPTKQEEDEANKLIVPSSSNTPTQ